MNLLNSQKKAAKGLRKKLKRYNMALLSGEPRSGKTLSFLDVLKDYKNPLVISQKNALPGIRKQAAALGVKVTVTNFHQVKKYVNNFDIVVIDEAHRWVTGYPKRSTIWGEIREYTKGKPVIFSSGTLTPEGYSGLFNMLALSDHSPWSRYPRFTLWFEDYGKPYTMKINMIEVKKYDRTQEEKVMKDVRKYTVTITRKESGHVHEATDKLIEVPQSKEQRKIYRRLQKDLIIEKLNLIADTPAKMLQKLHQVSGGFVKDEDGNTITLKHNPKMDWLQENMDPENTVVLAKYIAEQEALAEIFPHSGSIKKNAEGVDYSHIRYMVIYSLDFSAATYEQARARQMNIGRDHPVEIIYLMSGIDKAVYKAVSMKKNFTASWYRRNK